MKRFPLINLCLIICLSTSYGQIKISYDLGLNLSNLKGVSEKKNLLPGFNTGFSTQFSISNSFFARPSILYSLKGYRSNFIPQGTTSTKLSYLSIPALLGFNSSKKLSFLAGPEFSYSISAKRKFNNGSVNLNDKFEKFDFGLDFGAIYKIDERLGLELKYNMGLKKIEKFVVDFTNAYGYIYESFGKNRVLQINLFYYLKK